MFLDEDEETFGEAPALKGPAPADDIEAQSASAQKQKAYLQALGGVLDRFQDVPSSYEMLYKGKHSDPTASKILGAAASGIGDPMEQKQKAMEYMKMKREMTEAGEKDAFKERLKDDSSPAAMAYKQAAKVPAGMTALEALSLGYSPSRVGEIEARAAVDFDNAKKLEALKQSGDLKKFKAEQDYKRTEGSGEGAKAVDRDYAKEYNDWTSTGQNGLDKNLKRLQDAKAILEKRKKDIVGTSGRMTGRLPDWARSEESIRLRQDVQSAAQGALRATLGPQFTEKEGERIMSMSYDEKLSPQENINKIDAAIQELEGNRKNNNSKAAYYEANGSLRGYKSGATSAESANNHDAPKTKVVNGVTYVKVPGGWQEAPMTAGK